MSRSYHLALGKTSNELADLENNFRIILLATGQGDAPGDVQKSRWK